MDKILLRRFFFLLLTSRARVPSLASVQKSATATGAGTRVCMHDCLPQSFSHSVSSSIKPWHGQEPHSCAMPIVLLLHKTSKDIFLTPCTISNSVYFLFDNNGGWPTYITWLTYMKTVVSFGTHTTCNGFVIIPVCRAARQSFSPGIPLFHVPSSSLSPYNASSPVGGSTFPLK